VEHVDLSAVNWKQAFDEAELPIAELDNPFPLITGDLPYEAKNEVFIVLN
jgi:hypothetical protein